MSDNALCFRRGRAKPSRPIWKTSMLTNSIWNLRLVSSLLCCSCYVIFWAPSILWLYFDVILVLLWRHVSPRCRLTRCSTRRRRRSTRAARAVCCWTTCAVWTTRQSWCSTPAPSWRRRRRVTSDDDRVTTTLSSPARAGLWISAISKVGARGGATGTPYFQIFWEIPI